MISLLLATILVSTNSVSFTATSTDCGVDTQLEFLFVGPDSDRAYEAMFVTDDSIREISDAFSRAGFASSEIINDENSRFWPVGASVDMQPKFRELVRDLANEKDSSVPTPAIIFTGGARDANGELFAMTNMPSAVFALYNCAQSMLLLDEKLDQSVAYGRFQPAKKIAKGERLTFKFSRNQEPLPEKFFANFSSTNLSAQFLAMKEKSRKSALDVTTFFAKEMTLAEATACARALEAVDSTRIKINGFATNQFFYRAFLADDTWRDRQKRLAQPPEVWVKDDGTFVVTEIREDWSDKNSLDPKLSAIDHPCATPQEAAKIFTRLAAKTRTVFIFAKATCPLAKFYALREAAQDANILNWYFFATP